MGDVTRIEDARGEDGRVGLDKLAREGARRMIAAALEAEVDEYVKGFVEEVDESRRRLVVRNGRAQQRVGHRGVAGAARERPARRRAQRRAVSVLEPDPAALRQALAAGL